MCATNMSKLQLSVQGHQEGAGGLEGGFGGAGDGGGEWETAVRRHKPGRRR
jgi:hypothetical protein